MIFIRTRAVLLVLIIAIFVGSAMGVGTAVGVFNSSNGRNLPLYSVERDDNKMSLTFNCAWGNEDIDLVLDTLSSYDVLATFFIVGEWARKYPDSVKKIYEAGHEIGIHSYNHKDYTKITPLEIAEDIRLCDEAIMDAVGICPTLVRTPSGAYNDGVIDAVEGAGKICVQWSRDSVDYGDASVDDIYKRSIEKTAEGDILLMHTGTKNTAAALPRVLDSLTSRFELVSVSSLMIDGDFYVDNTGRMFPK